MGNRYHRHLNCYSDSKGGDMDGQSQMVVSNWDQAEEKEEEPPGLYTYTSFGT